MKGKGTGTTKQIVKKALPKTIFFSTSSSTSYAQKRTILQKQEQIISSASLESGGSGANIPITPYMAGYAYRAKLYLFDTYQRKQSTKSVAGSKREYAAKHRNISGAISDVDEYTIPTIPPNFDLIKFLEGNTSQKKKAKYSDVIEEKEISYVEERISKDVEIIERQMIETAYAEQEILTISATELKSTLDKLDKSKKSQETLVKTLIEMGLDINLTKEQLADEAQKILLIANPIVFPV